MSFNNGIKPYENNSMNHMLGVSYIDILTPKIIAKQNDSIINMLKLVNDGIEAYLELLSVAIIHKNLEIIKFIIENYIDSEYDSINMNALCFFKLILPNYSKMISNDFKENYIEKKCYFTLMAGIGGNINIFKYLFENKLIQELNIFGVIGLSEEHKNIINSNIIGACAYYGNYQLLEYLLENYRSDLDINVTTEEENSKKQKTHFSKELSETNPTLLACAGPSSDEKTYEILKILEDNKANFYNKDFNENNIIHIATRKNKIQTLKFLINSLCLEDFIDEKNNEKFTPYDIATKMENKEIISFFNNFRKKENNLEEDEKILSGEEENNKNNNIMTNVEKLNEIKFTGKEKGKQYYKNRKNEFQDFNNSNNSISRRYKIDYNNDYNKNYQFKNNYDKYNNNYNKNNYINNYDNKFNKRNGGLYKDPNQRVYYNNKNNSNYYQRNQKYNKRYHENNNNNSYKKNIEIEIKENIPKEVHENSDNYNNKNEDSQKKEILKEKEKNNFEEIKKEDLKKNEDSDEGSFSEEGFLSEKDEIKYNKDNFLKYKELYKKYCEAERKCYNLEKEKKELCIYINKMNMNKKTNINNIPNNEENINSLLKFANKEFKLKDKYINKLKKDCIFTDLSNIKDFDKEKLEKYKQFYLNNLEIINYALNNK